MLQSINGFNIGDAVIVSDTAMIYAAIPFGPEYKIRVGIVLGLKNARTDLDLDNDANLLEVFLPTGEVELIWEEDLVPLNNKT